jgi:hypothetical protein
MPLRPTVAAIRRFLCGDGEEVEAQAADLK